MDFAITRRIEIDAGHRIASHGSKCRHLHGHRYVVEATCRAASGELVREGEQSGMVLDFGFLKDEMVRIVDGPCDHGLIVAIDDNALLGLFAPAAADGEAWVADATREVAAVGYAERTGAALGQKLYLVPFPPTAECLARHWFERLSPAIAARSTGRAELVGVTVWETPNCRADFGLANMIQPPRLASEQERSY
ncbi:6-pyruvoyltetrahydropterin/6-carboxytetrahydropterin synthase [Stella humosa]|uniref:6-carboxy-5,6,7,8-tetrahydropterin synthase n=1 Tax=Stella humosa TaxID=94 RepID=A0A3N1LJH6_9PROT|nr:6-carboxytetrahydropterin synthase [Stella humosa]ROP90566.1 6-pyruvoyltetrahydropterin/6-carboxytetrahydropterin synthase [Stella humosa]BBK29539.1 6-pyruvoyltetrahydropterin synthase [Stella humosa]